MLEPSAEPCGAGAAPAPQTPGGPSVLPVKHRRGLGCGHGNAASCTWFNVLRFPRLLHLLRSKEPLSGKGLGAL